MTFAQVMLRLVLLLVCLLIGAISGGVLASLLATQRGRMGFDALADFLGGVMLGSLAGFLVGGGLAWRLPADHLGQGVGYAIAALAVEVGTITLLNVIGYW